MFNCFVFLERRLSAYAAYVCFTRCFVAHIFLEVPVLKAGHLSRLRQWDDRASLCKASGFGHVGMIPIQIQNQRNPGGFILFFKSVTNNPTYIAYTHIHIVYICNRM